MTKDDKQFLTGLIGQQDKKFTGLFKRMEEGIRENGVLIEGLNSDIQLVSEGVSDLNRRMKNVESDVSDIKEAICDYPTVRSLVQKHGKQLAKLT